MPHYLTQVAYTPEGWNAMLKDPEGRRAMVRATIEKLGGKIDSQYFAFGDYDVIGIAEFPDNISAAAIAMAVSAGGAVRSVKTTPLLSGGEAQEAMRRAANSGYRAASAGA